MAIQFFEGQILFSGDPAAIAFHEDCCEPCICPCTPCNPAPTSVIAQFDNVADAGCPACDPNYNNLDYELDCIAECTYRGIGECGHNITATLEIDGGQFYWKLVVAGDVRFESVRFGSIFSLHNDCSGAWEMSVVLRNDVECDWSAATATLNVL